MMEQNPSRPARKVAIADHIWEVFEEMAQQMGSDRDALINQAMFMFARLNGFLDSAVASPGAARPAAKPAQPVLSPVAKPPVREEPPPPAPLRRPADERAQQQQRLDDDPVRREVAERVLETAAELERLIKGKSDRVEEQEEPPVDEPLGDEPMDEELPPDDSELSAEDGSEPGGAQLYLMMEGGEMDRVTKDRFIIGRGKHCDFVINSGKVSREHAMIVRESEEYFIEDLGSSNGTWFNKQRIKRRKIEDGDEYYICSEKIKVVMR